MYIPPHFSMENPEELVAFMKEYNFALLVSSLDGEPYATHLPFMIKYEEDTLFLLAHMAKENPQLKNLETQPVLVVFSEPHAYISPSLYESYPNVPTWNYVAVHVYGQLKCLDTAKTLQLMEETVAHFEPQKERFWDNLPTTYRNRLLDAVVAFEIQVTRVEGKKKLNQNRTEKDRELVRTALEMREDANARKIAALMEKEAHKRVTN